jgi:hypothetical protein
MDIIVTKATDSIYTFMFTNSTRLANIILIVTALALCVSACTEPKADSFTLSRASSYDAASTSGSLVGLTHSGYGY